MNEPKSERSKAPLSPADMVREIVGAITKMEYEGDCRAIAAIVIDKDGDIHRLSACRGQTDLVTLIGGTVTLQHKLMGDTRALKKERD
jgi:hypothetical protein